MSDRYDYMEAVKDDIREYIDENEIEINSVDDFDELYDDLFIEDSVTGNASGSYYCNSWKAEESLCHNIELLLEALNEFGEQNVDTLEKGAEWCDVTIRCYLLSSALSEVIEEILEEKGGK